MTGLGLAALGLLLGGWILYPLGLWLGTRWSRPLPAEPPTASPRPDVEVIIATREPAGAIRARVEDLLTTEYPSDRVRITVALDATAAEALPAVSDALAGLPAARVVMGDLPGGKAAALNAAVRAARAEILIFSDTAQSFEPGAIGALVDCLADPAVAGASGYLAARGDRGVLGKFWSYETAVRALESRADSLVGVTGAVYALRRAAWVPLRAGLINDDLAVPLLARRRGGRIVHCPAAVATDPRVFTRSQQYARRVRTLTGIYQLVGWYPWTIVPVANPLWLQFVCHKMIRLLTPGLLLLAGIGLLPFVPRGLVVRAALLAVSLGVLGAIVARRHPLRLFGEVGWAVRLLILAPTAAAWYGLRGRWSVWGPGPGGTGGKS